MYTALDLYVYIPYSMFNNKHLVSIYHLTVDFPYPFLSTPTTSPLVTTTQSTHFSVSTQLFCSFMLFFCFYFFLTPLMGKIIWHLSSPSDLFISLSIIPSRSIHVATSRKISSFCGRVVFHYICVYIFIFTFMYTFMYILHLSLCLYILHLYPFIYDMY